MPKDTESIIDKFNDQTKATEEKPEKQVEEEVKPKDEETEAVEEQSTADKPVEKSTDKKEDSEKEEKPKDKDKDTDEKDKKSKKSKEDESDKKEESESKSEVKKSEEPEAKEPQDDVAKDDKVETTVDKHLSDGEEIINLAKSFKEFTDRQAEFETAVTDKVDSVSKSVDELTNQLLPLLKKTASYFSNEENTSLPDLEDSPNPEETAIKSANLEEKQHAEQVEKSTNTANEDSFAKDESSKVIDDVISKSESTEEESETVEKSTTVETQVEEPKQFNVGSLDDDSLRLTALGAVNPFFNRMTTDRRNGALTDAEVANYQNMIKDVQNDNTTRQELEQFVEYARGN